MLEQKIKIWKKTLHKNRSLEDGYIEELEQHLRDEIENNIAKGLFEEEAFKNAVENLGDSSTIEKEYYKSDTTNKVSGKPSWQKSKWMPDLMWSHFKSASRYLMKNKSYLSVSIACLIIGFISFILCSLYVFDELNYDTFHKDFDKTYRVVEHEKGENSNGANVAQVATQIGPAAKETIPGVEDMTRLFVIGRMTIGNDVANRGYERIWIPDANFFSFFDFKLLSGNPETALKEPNSIVLTESTAIKYFGKTDIVGERLFTSLFDVTVTGVMEDFPKNSHIGMNMLVSEPSFANRFEGWSQFHNNDWDSRMIITYLKIHETADLSEIENKIQALVAKNSDDPNEQIDEFSLQPLGDIHLYAAGIDEAMNLGKSNLLYIYMFGIIGTLILLIACFNYMNLNISSALKRTKEIALRKVIGADHKQIISQFTSEALLLSVLSLIVALVIAFFSLPIINNNLGKDISFSAFSVELFISVISLIVVITLLSTIYPAITMYKVRPADALHSRSNAADGKVNFKKILVVLQFSVSFAMILSTIVIYSQLEYMRNKNLGMKVNDLVVMDINSDNLRDSYEAFKAEVLNLEGINSFTASNRVPGDWKIIPKVGIKNSLTNQLKEISFISADEDFLSTYNIDLIKGRNFMPGRNDSGNVLINSLAAKILGIDSPGSQLDIADVRFGSEISELNSIFRTDVIGIVDDFHFESLREKKKPIIISYYKNPVQNIDYYTFDVSTRNWSALYGKIIEVNRKFDPENPVEYNFLEEKFGEFYEADKKRAYLFIGFSLISILIACLGLYALISFTVERRTKEIGIRKVMGATEIDIYKLISVSFVAIIIIGCAISAPLAVLSIKSWLQEFAYRITVSWWMYATALVGTLLVAFSTISYKVLKAARMNPVDSMRNE